MRIRVLVFARLRELLGASELPLELQPGARAGDAWAAMVQRCPALGEFRASARVACNGTLVAPDHALGDGDEIALLPPVGGG